jgi:hypothetical protein
MTPPQHIVNAIAAAAEGCKDEATKNEVLQRQFLQKIDRRREGSGRRRRPNGVVVPMVLNALLVATLPQIISADENCPPTHSGWAPSQDCSSYHWCSNGKLSSLSYACHEGLLFDSSQLTCAPAETVNCGAFWQHFVNEMAAPPPPPPSPSSLEEFSQPTLPTPMPSPRPSMLGEPIYYADFPSQSCKSDVSLRPLWVSTDHMFTTKRQCCEEMIDWIDLDKCLGDGWVETNFVFEPTSNPTVRPTQTPSVMPTLAPSIDVTGLPSLSPSEALSFAPSLAPSYTSTQPPVAVAASVMASPPTSHPVAASEATVGASSSSSRVQDDSYLMELLEWANADLDPYSWQNVVQRSRTIQTASSSSNSDTAITELLLPAVTDATISRQRPDVNFGLQSALAVDGGNSRDEKYESLIKFDVSFIDNDRPLEAATLKLHVIAGCTSGGLFSSTLNNQDWAAETVTWNSAPATDGHSITTLGQVVQGQTVTVDLTPAISWHKASSQLSSSKYMTIRIESNEHSRCLYSSMEGLESQAPKLEIKYMPEVATASAGGESLLTLAHGDFFELTATDDATVVALQSERNFGQEANLLVAYDSHNRNIIDTLIRFDLSQIQDMIPRSVVLSLFAETDCASAGTFATTSANLPWSEDSLTWSNSPVYDSRAVGGTMIGTFGELKAGHWYGFNVQEAVAAALLAGNDSVTFRLSSGNLNPCQYTSRNGGRAPKLVVAF